MKIGQDFFGHYNLPLFFIYLGAGAWTPGIFSVQIQIRGGGQFILTRQFRQITINIQLAYHTVCPWSLVQYTHDIKIAKTFWAYNIYINYTLSYAATCVNVTTCPEYSVKF